MVYDIIIVPADIEKGKQYFVQAVEPDGTYMCRQIIPPGERIPNDGCDLEKRFPKDTAYLKLCQAMPQFN